MENQDELNEIKQLLRAEKRASEALQKIIRDDEINSLKLQLEHANDKLKKVQQDATYSKSKMTTQMNALKKKLKAAEKKLKNAPMGNSNSQMIAVDNDGQCENCRILLQRLDDARKEEIGQKYGYKFSAESIRLSNGGFSPEYSPPKSAQKSPRKKSSVRNSPPRVSRPITIQSPPPKSPKQPRPITPKIEAQKPWQKPKSPKQRPKSPKKKKKKAKKVVTESNPPMQFGGDSDKEKEEEIAAPPLSSAQALIDKLDAMDGAFAAPTNLVPCEQCGRKFNEKALVRHKKICKKVFGEKRKAFKSQAVDDEAKKAKKGINQAKIEKELKAKRERAKAKWKAESSMLRNVVKRENAIKTGKPMPEMEEEPEPVDMRTECPYCHRKFADATAKRHIPHCKESKLRNRDRNKKSYKRRGNKVQFTGF